MNRMKQHKWTTYYSPRNGRISIQACSECGVAKSFVVGDGECKKVAEETMLGRLRGWSVDEPEKPDDRLDIA